MGKIVETYYECYGCEYKHKSKIRKPKLMQPTVIREKCYVCETMNGLIFEHVGPGSLRYGYLTKMTKLSPEGEKKLKERTEKKNKTANYGRAKPTRGIKCNQFKLH